MKILIVEDHQSIIEVVSIAIHIRWPEATLIATNLGKECIELVKAESPDLLILDLGLPDMDGFNVLKQVRFFSAVPIIILTIRDEEKDIVRGLEWGADEYIIKPFRQLELLARIQALLRRKLVVNGEPHLEYGPLYLDLFKHELFINRKKISLTNTESIILYCLIKNANRIVTLQELAATLWDRDYPDAAHAIRVYIRRLREKIETDPSHPQLIHTNPGIGYTLKKPS